MVSRANESNDFLISFLRRLITCAVSIMPLSVSHQVKVQVLCKARLVIGSIQRLGSAAAARFMLHVTCMPRNSCGGFSLCTYGVLGNHHVLWRQHTDASSSGI